MFRKLIFLSVMPPGCPHAVFTPEHSLTFGGAFYTLPLLGSSLRILGIQDRAGSIFSNEDISERDLTNVIEMLKTCEALLREKLLSPGQLASVVSSNAFAEPTDNRLKQTIREQITRLQREVENRIEQDT
jgi:hypothetical protein